MLMLLAPSKTMDMSPHFPRFVVPTEPYFIHDAMKIAAAIKGLSGAEVEAYMHVSASIAANVRAMYTTWHSNGKKPALWAYRGDVYKGMKADELSEQQAIWAQQHLLIMSGLYGILRPFDAISAYRLEMKANFPLDQAKNVYDFWDVKLGECVAKRAKGLIYNLASDEYARPVTRHLPKSVQVITPVFYDNRPNGTVGKAPIYNKMMRGVLARWMIDRQVETPHTLREFSMHGYYYDATRSTANEPAFYREKMTPLVF